MKKNKTSAIGIIITIVILILVVVLSNLPADKSYFFSNGVNRLFLPIQNGLIFIMDKISGKDQELSDIDKLKEENQKLKEENTKLKEDVRELEIISEENNSLKEYMGLKEKYPDYETVSAKILEKSFSNYEKIVVIDAGTKDGINVNMAVISTQGLVGHVISVTETSAKVQTIVDTASTVSSKLSSSNDAILLKGTISSTNTVKATSIPVNTTILQGDNIITSGMGGIYPKGILVGTVKEIVNTKNDMDRYANVATAVDFNSVDNVLVIKSY